MTTGKLIALTRQMFVGKVMALLYNTLSRLLINRGREERQKKEKENERKQANNETNTESPF